MLTAAMDDISETEFGQYQNVNLDWTFSCSALYYVEVRRSP